MKNGQCGWCETELRCGPMPLPFNSTDGKVVTKGNYQWTCKGTKKQTGAALLYGHDYQCGVIQRGGGHAQSGPLVYAAITNVPIDAVPTSGMYELNMTLENVGERNHSDAACPGEHCNQVIAAGPFNCSKYVNGSFVQEEGAMGYYTDYKCKELPGIGSEAYDLQIHVYGMPPSTITTEKACNRTLTFAAPTITTIACPTTTTNDTCGGDAGDIITITGTNFPKDNATVLAWEAYKGYKPNTGALPGFQITIGGVPCLESNFTSTTAATCKIPVSNGINQPIRLTVGGQADVSAKVNRFNFNPPKVKSVYPTSGPSYGGEELLIEGEHFGVAGLEVYLQAPDGSRIPATIVSFNDTSAIVTQPMSASAAAVAFKVNVLASQQYACNEANCQSTLPAFDTKACSEVCSGSDHYCMESGDCLCTGNYVGKKTGPPQPTMDTCSCPTTSPCVGGTFDADNCACSCEDNWEPSPAPVGWPVGQPSPAKCDSCSVPCTGSLQQKMPKLDGNTCQCHFAGAHVVWMVFLGLLVIAGIVMGVIYYRKQQASSAQYAAAGYTDALNRPAAKHEPLQEEPERESTTSQTYF